MEHLQLTNLQLEKVVSRVYPCMESSAWCVHPKMLLQTLLCSAPAHESDTVQKALQVRAMGAEWSLVRTRHNVTLDKEVTRLQNLLVCDPMKTNEPV